MINRDRSVEDESRGSLFYLTSIGYLLDSYWILLVADHTAMIGFLDVISDVYELCFEILYGHIQCVRSIPEHLDISKSIHFGGKCFK